MVLSANKEKRMVSVEPRSRRINSVDDVRSGTLPKCQSLFYFKTSSQCYSRADDHTLLTNEIQRAYVSLSSSLIGS